jgi:acetyl esterase
VATRASHLEPRPAIPLRTRVFWEIYRRVEGTPLLQRPASEIRKESDKRRKILGLPGAWLLTGRADRGASVSDSSFDRPDGTALPLRIYRPTTSPGSAALPVLVYFHGGGWVAGDPRQSEWWCAGVAAQTPAVVVSVDYRLAPEHQFPVPVEDCYAALCWVAEHAGELGVDAERIAVGGDSAGGNLAAVVCQLARDDGGPAPGLQWLIYPRTDFTAQTRSLSLFARGFVLTKRDMDWFESQYLRRSDLDRADPRVSPLLAESLSGLAPALIAVAGFDPLRDEGESYAAALRAAGTAVDLRSMGSLTHGFANLFPLGGGSAAATSDLISALRAHLSRA